MTTARDDFAKYVYHHVDVRYTYVVFEKCARTLKDIITNADIHLSRRHVVEIFSQIIEVVIHLNNHSIYDMDLCPDNFEVVDGDASEWFYDQAHNGFRPRKVLATTKIRFTYYGRVGNDPSHSLIADEYKSPEHVYGKHFEYLPSQKKADLVPDMGVTASSNVFSTGCILAELLTRKPLFPACVSGPLYIREKSVAFDAVLGPFSDTMIQDIRRSFRGVFKYENLDFPNSDNISSEVKGFCERSEPLRYAILEEFAGNVVECMTHLDHDTRVSLQDLTHHPFMDVTSM